MEFEVTRLGKIYQEAYMAHQQTVLYQYLDLIAKRRFYYAFKRVIDICGSLAGLILLAPLFLVVIILIKKEEPRGPIFFTQYRSGRNGRKFKMYKFRSMCVNAETELMKLMAHNEIEGLMFKMKDDPRVTNIGRFIRKYSIDELPQLVNVLKGDMSLVGPRPPLEWEVLEYSKRDLLRLLVKPGCAGLWQISGRNDVGFEDMVNLDIEYIEKQGIWFDFKIMVKTVMVMIWPNGAY